MIRRATTKEEEAQKVEEPAAEPASRQFNFRDMIVLRAILPFVSNVNKDYPEKISMPVTEQINVIGRATLFIRNICVHLAIIYSYDFKSSARNAVTRCILSFSTLVLGIMFDILEVILQVTHHNPGGLRTLSPVIGSCLISFAAVYACLSLYHVTKLMKTNITFANESCTDIYKMIITGEAEETDNDQENRTEG